MAACSPLPLGAARPEAHRLQETAQPIAQSNRTRPSSERGELGEAGVQVVVSPVREAPARAALAPKEEVEVRPAVQAVARQAGTVDSSTEEQVGLEGSAPGAQVERRWAVRVATVEGGETPPRAALAVAAWTSQAQTFVG